MTRLHLVPTWVQYSQQSFWWKWTVFQTCTLFLGQTDERDLDSGTRTGRLSVQMSTRHWDEVSTGFRCKCLRRSHIKLSGWTLMETLNFWPADLYQSFFRKSFLSACKYSNSSFPPRRWWWDFICALVADKAALMNAGGTFFSAALFFCSRHPPSITHGFLGFQVIVVIHHHC